MKETVEKRTYNNVTFEVRTFDIEGAFETKRKSQCFYNDQVLTDIENNQAEAIMRAIHFINMYPEKF